jgi:predicted ATPase/Tfp pilus assembly protein PilF
MAPEVLDGNAPQPVSDLYALAVLLHQLVSGRYPWKAESLTELREKQGRGDRQSLRELLPDLSPAFAQVVERGLNRDPKLRYLSASEMESALLAAMGSPSAKRHTLPGEPDQLIGREAELAGLGREIDRGARLITIVGPGGMGKTRLALRYGWHGLEAWTGGVWFCDLAEAKGVDGIVTGVAAGLGVPLGKEDPIEQLGHAIAGRGRSLIILDNFEQVVGQAQSTVGRWLARAVEARFVVTSRERLNVPGETLLVVEPLPVESGIELFVERAQRQRPSFHLDQPDERAADAIREVVELLDGIPLAIELAAARMRVMTPAQMLGQMKDRFRMLSGGARGGGRHATLRATIDGSWELLQPWERAAFAQCSVFQGGFTLEAAEGVIDLSPWPDAPWVLDVVQSLVDKSLLRTLSSETSGATRGPVRFGMFASLQDYARGKLEQEGAVIAAEERHARWYSRYGTEEAIEALDQRGGVERRQVLAGELENLITACRRAVRRGDGRAAAGACRASWAVIELRGPFGQAAELAREVLSHPQLGREERQELLKLLGQAEKASGHVEEARAQFEAALALNREVGDRRLRGVLLGSLGGLLADQGRREEAHSYYEEALAIHREMGNRRFEGMVLGNLGIMQLHQGRMDEARAHFEGALTIAREVGNRRSEGAVFGNLGNLYNNQGRMEEARFHYEQALAIAREVGNRQGEGIVISGLGNLQQDQGRMEEARGHYESSIAIHREMGHRRLEGIAVGNRGLLRLRQGRFEEARADMEAALAIHREVGNRRFEGIVLGQLGILDHDQGRIGEARAHFDAALDIHREVHNRRFEGLVLGSLGNLLHHQGQIEEARDAITTGEEILRHVGDRYALGTLLCARAELELGDGDDEAARATLAEAETLATQVGAGNGSELGLRLIKLRQALTAESI